jgi:hypothetical protein
MVFLINGYVRESQVYPLEVVELLDAAPQFQVAIKVN